MDAAERIAQALGHLEQEYDRVGRRFPVKDILSGLGVRAEVGNIYAPVDGGSFHEPEDYFRIVQEAQATVQRGDFVYLRSGRRGVLVEHWGDLTVKTGKDAAAAYRQHKKDEAAYKEGEKRVKEITRREKRKMRQDIARRLMEGVNIDGFGRRSGEQAARMITEATFGFKLPFDFAYKADEELVRLAGKNPDELDPDKIKITAAAVHLIVTTSRGSRIALVEYDRTFGISDSAVSGRAREIAPALGYQEKHDGSGHLYFARNPQ